MLKLIYCYISETSNDKTLNFWLDVASLVRNDILAVLYVHKKDLVTSSRLLFHFSFFFAIDPVNMILELT